MFSVDTSTRPVLLLDDKENREGTANSLTELFM